MISRELEAEILRLHHAEGWPVGTLARQLRVHHSTVRRVLGQAGIPAAHQYARPLMVEPFVPFIQETLGRYPTLRASRLPRRQKSDFCRRIKSDTETRGHEEGV